jgi:transcriptional regulator with XRE-family HTH domain
MDFVKKQMKKLTPARRREVKIKAVQIVLCNRLRRLREMMGMTQEQLARKIGVKQPMISQIEGGDDMMVSTLINYVKGLGCGISIRIMTNKKCKIIDEKTGKVILTQNLNGYNYITV